jgi:predicted nucleotidyltransferase
MDSASVIAALKRHEAELRALGIERLSIFGSTARGDAPRLPTSTLLFC